MPGPMIIEQLLPATGWYGLYAKRLDTGELELWTEPLIAWALAHQDCSEEGEDEEPEQFVVGMVVWGIQGVVSCTETGGFVLTYVREGEDLGPHRGMAETLISTWEKRDDDELNQELRELN